MTSESESLNDELTKEEREEIHERLREVARDVLGKPDERAELGWSVLVDSGWLGLEVSERLGGGGAGFRETGLILTEFGRAATTSSYLGSSVLGVGILQLIEPGELRDDLLERLAAGSIRVSAVLPTGDETSVQFRLKGSSRERLVLEGIGDFIPDAHEADFLIVLATSSSSGLVAAVVERGSEGIDVTPRPVLDSTRRLARVSAESVSVNPETVLGFSNPDDALRHILERGAAALACDSLGIIGALLDETVAYVSARKQFGRAIGSFQAVKHACADMFVSYQVSAELVGACLEQIAVGDEDRSTAVSMAKSYVTERAVEVAGKAVQLHGGIGYTWEAGLHVYQKRALLNRSLFGSPVAHRRHLAKRYG
jgi:alkylation response protein AidB-like acyl-CoA dehydrogenase